MKINKESVLNRESWEKVGVNVPQYDYNTVKKHTHYNPRWLHFGAGNIFRAFPAAIHQKLLDANKVKYGIIVAEGYDYEIINRIYRPFDNHGLLVTLKSDGQMEKTIISSITESLKVDQSSPKDFSRLKEIMSNPELQMISFTITEKAYIVTGKDKELNPDILKDVSQEIDNANSYMGKLVSLLHHRFIKGAFPIALVSMDNCSRNGKQLHDAILNVAKAWEENGFVTKEFIDYLDNEDKVTYPWSMIDKITPRPDKDVEKHLKELNIENVEPVITEKGTYISTFVNAEEAEYLVIEDKFPNGRPPLDEVGVIFTDRNTVNKVEKMKVSTCLNPLHTALAIFGNLLSFDKISEEMKDKELLELTKQLGYQEGLPVVVDPKIINPKEFIDEVINVRFPNPFLPDTPQRIATDTSQKLAIRFGETVKAYEKPTELEVEELEIIPLVFAGWLRYLLGVDDLGNKFELSSDPLLPTLKPYIDRLELGDVEDIADKLEAILSMKAIFGIDLYQNGMASKVIEYMKSMMQGPGAVRETLNKVLFK